MLYNFDHIHSFEQKNKELKLKVIITMYMLNVLRDQDSLISSL